MQIRKIIKDLKLRNILNDYPCSDLLHNALRFIRKGMPEVAYGEICCAIIKSGGELTEEERECLKEMGKGGVEDVEIAKTPTPEHSIPLDTQMYIRELESRFDRIVEQLEEQIELQKGRSLNGNSYRDGLRKSLEIVKGGVDNAE